MLLPLFAAAATAGAVAASHRPWMDAAEPPRARAQKLAAAMTLDEQLGMLHGSCHEWPRPKGVLGFTGRVCAVDRLGIPELRLNDGPVGFRCSGCEGSTTSWPASINLAAGFDRGMTRMWGAAMGREWYSKGANNQLGPGLSLARLPNNGRLWEYISGEDPYLGFHMGAAVTEGIQSEGVVATAKHFVDNSQEEDRGTVTEIVDERTQFEMYYPPFEGAISAGLGAIMCSFNLECVGDLECAGVNATLNARHSCENHDTLQRDLKGRLGFQGYVMSDWDAAHSSSINEGLDMEMPAGKWMNQSKLLAMLAEGNTTAATIAESATRILWGLFETGLMDRPNVNGSIYHNVSTLEHIQLARTIAARSAVLLQNKGAILPLGVAAAARGVAAGATRPASDSSGAVKEIAVIGVQALHPTFHSSGSGQVAAAYAPAPLDSLRDALGVPTGEDCRADKTVCVRYNTGGNHQDAAKLAAAADVAIVFVACTGSEGQDRLNLTLSGGADAVGGQDELISTVAAAAANRTVVVAVTPGAILTPWRDSVAAIIIAFMPGQQYGHAITDVLLGHMAPAGKLPVTFPAEENQVGFTNLTWGGNHSFHQSGSSVSSNHSERLEIGYRWYDAHGSAPAFSFGHGLPGYSTFSYTDLAATATSVRFTLENTGAVAATETPQLYLSFPSSAGEPPWQLKGFQKTALAAGAKATVVIPLTARDFSVWSVDTHAWKEVRGTFGVVVGSSSRDHRLAGSIKVNN